MCLERDLLMDISIIVPCYDEIDNVTKLVSELIPVTQKLAANQTVELILVDDGSTDGTLSSLQEYLGDNSVLNEISVKFERHSQNLGLGAAIRTGFAAATGQIIVTTDSDGTYKFENIPFLLQHLTDEIDIVTASPYHPGGEVVGVSGNRLLLSKGSSLIYRILVDWKIHTYTCLFRAYRRTVIENIFFTANGFLAGTELLVKAMVAGYRVIEFPATLHSRSYGVSKAKIVRTIWAHLQFQTLVLLHRLHLKPLVNNVAKGAILWPQSNMSSPEEY